MGSIVILGGNMNHLYEAYVKDLLINSKWHYLIPEYQRGYRWRPEEVELLIDDISGYADEKEYFLNVLILQKNNEGETSYDIVDGQQRLTTLSILEKYCGVKSDSISDLLEKGRRESDKYFIERAKAKAEEIIGKNIEPFKRKLGECRFFVYEIDGSKEDAAKVFERINTGKIPLSSAELLKAEWVSEKTDSISQKIRASRWQRIEKLLQNDDFFFFICPNRRDRRYQATRMDYVLELYFSRDNNDSKLYKEKYEKSPIFLYRERKSSLCFFENSITPEVFPDKNGLAYLANLINSAVDNKQFTRNPSGYYVSALPDLENEKWIDGIGNLVLLPASINRSFGNWPYPLKCEVIKDACETQSQYIPFCVEEKYDRQCRVEWNIESRNEYIQHLKKLFALEEKNGN